ncbi:MAG: lactate utilization protein [Fibrobacteres bacterium]|nr:lactate utilization protein [Fibrobacterota bacterium]
MSDARLAILSKVRQAQIRAYIPEAKSGLPARLAYPALDPGALRFRLLEEFALLGVEAFVEASEADVRRRLSGLIDGKSVLSWDPDHLPYGAGDCLTGAKTVFGSDSRDEQGQAEIGLTGCENAIAETGTLAVTSGPGRPRAASLMPITHVVLIRASDILLGMGEYFRKTRETADRGNVPLPYVVFITGPSRTADIELSLTLGVHGPGRVIAILGP